MPTDESKASSESSSSFCFASCTEEANNRSYYQTKTIFLQIPQFPVEPILLISLSLIKPQSLQNKSDRKRTRHMQQDKKKRLRENDKCRACTASAIVASVSWPELSSVATGRGAAASAVSVEAWKRRDKGHTGSGNSRI